jgi:hypothetical protein
VFLPVLRQFEALPAGALRNCLDELRVRGELTPASFTIDDARDLCTRMAQIYAPGVSDQALRTEVRPIYRQLFELLVGTTAIGGIPLTEAPLAARTEQGIKFLPAREVVYASVSGSRERSGIQGRVPLFVIEAEPGAQRPLRDLFGAPVLETALEWSAVPGDPVLDGAELEAFREGLRALVAPLLARLGAERADRGGSDALALQTFVEKVEPVESLTLNCGFRGKDLGPIPQRTYYVGRTAEYGFQGFAVWTGPAWPPIAEDAQTLAMALAENLEVNTVETFLSFINANPAQRQQLLQLAGAAELLAEVEAGLSNPIVSVAVADGSADPATAEEAAKTDGEATEATPSHTAHAPAASSAAAPRVPLHRFEDLLMDGDVIRVEGLERHNGAVAAHSAGDPKSGTETSGDGGRAPRAAAGTDLNELDRLGMMITIAFESRRFDGRTVAVLPGKSDDSADVLIVDVSSPATIAAAKDESEVVTTVFEQLELQGISSLYPGFDILTILDGEVDRMIELKSSGVDSHVQAMSWNEWKTAQGSLQARFWLYLVGNLRADLQNASPFLRAVRDPFGTLHASEHEDTIRTRTVQLRVREFAAADQLTLEVSAPRRPT